jgi:hypothetical protein
LVGSRQPKNVGYEILLVERLEKYSPDFLGILDYLKQERCRQNKKNQKTKRGDREEKQ